jgi:hypothetical protein
MVFDPPRTALAVVVSARLLLVVALAVGSWLASGCADLYGLLNPSSPAWLAGAVGGESRQRSSICPRRRSSAMP